MGVGGLALHEWMFGERRRQAEGRGRVKTRFWTGRKADLEQLALIERMCRIMCRRSHMATNLSLDPALIARALEVSGEKTKKAAVTRALEEFIARRKQKLLLDLMGKLEWDESFDYKAERSRR